MQLLEDQPHRHLSHDHLVHVWTHLTPQLGFFDPHHKMAEMNHIVTKFGIVPAMTEVPLKSDLK